MDLRKRLAQLDRLTRKPHDEAVPPVDPEQRSAQTLQTLVGLGLNRRTTTLGSIWETTFVDSVSEPTDPLPDMNEVFTQGGRIRPGFRSVLFLDTETTGLVGGTGTIAFLVGASWWTDEGFITRQYFLPDPGHETAMLEDLGALATEFRVLVTFNGASFDLPLLRTRARMNRLEDPLADLVGWDLLVPSRRLWGHRLEKCRQQTLENEICGLSRQEGDIDGSRIPQVWFDFLSAGEPGLLANVLTHNHRDMVGMACLFKEVVRAAGQIEGDMKVFSNLTWDQAWALGRICEKRRDTPTSLALMNVAVAKVPDASLADRRFLADAVRILKRGGHWNSVEKMLAGGLRQGLDEPWIHREAAILYEHRLVDLGRALDHARKSGEDHRVDRLRLLTGGGEAGA